MGLGGDDVMTMATVAIAEALAGRMVTYGWRIWRGKAKWGSGWGWSGWVRGRRGRGEAARSGTDAARGVGVGCGTTLRAAAG